MSFNLLKIHSSRIKKWKGIQRGIFCVWESEIFADISIVDGFCLTGSCLAAMKQMLLVFHSLAWIFVIWMLLIFHSVDWNFCDTNTVTFSTLLPWFLWTNASSFPLCWLEFCDTNTVTFSTLLPGFIRTNASSFPLCYLDFCDTNAIGFPLCCLDFCDTNTVDFHSDDWTLVSFTIWCMLFVYIIRISGQWILKMFENGCLQKWNL